MKYPNMTWSRMQAVIDKLGGEDGVDRFLSGKLRLIDSNNAKPAPAPALTLTVWREVAVYPVEAEPAVIIASLTQADFYVSAWAKDIISDLAYKTLTEPRKLKLVRMRVRDLGFKEKPTIDQIWQRIFEVGGELCPPELGPTLRKEFADQPVGNYFWLIMKQISSTGVFFIRRFDSGERWLGAGYAGRGQCWSLNREIVFVLRK